MLSQTQHTRGRRCFASVRGVVKLQGHKRFHRAFGLPWNVPGQEGRQAWYQSIFHRQSHHGGMQDTEGQRFGAGGHGVQDCHGYARRRKNRHRRSGQFVICLCLYLCFSAPTTIGHGRWLSKTGHVRLPCNWSILNRCKLVRLQQYVAERTGLRVLAFTTAGDLSRPVITLPR